MLEHTTAPSNSDAENRRALPAQLFDIGGNAPTATATGWRQLDGG